MDWRCNPRKHSALTLTTIKTPKHDLRNSPNGQACKNVKRLECKNVSCCMTLPHNGHQARQRHPVTSCRGSYSLNITAPRSVSLDASSSYVNHFLKVNNEVKHVLMSVSLPSCSKPCQSATKATKLPREILTTPTKTVLNVCVCALGTQPLGTYLTRVS